MALTYYQRKERLPFGAGLRVAEELGVSAVTVSKVVRGLLRHRAVEIKLARLMRDPETHKPVSVTEAFGPASRSMRRAQSVAA